MGIKSSEPCAVSTNSISLCKNCWCMTHTINGKCGKCGEMKERQEKMKIIDFRKKGNAVRFYLGANDCEDYHGDDWNDTPYEHNAGEVYGRYIKGYYDITFPFDFSVLEPCDGHDNSSWCKDDMKARKVPCIVAIISDSLFSDDFDKMNADDRALKFYFGDEMEPTYTTVVVGEEGKKWPN